jgi:hypothetical protein
MLLKIADKVDRYDIRGPSSMVNNYMNSRLNENAAILNQSYHRIIYDTGDLYPLNTGNLNPKSDDMGLLNSFLSNLTTAGGVYLCGDNIAEQLNNDPLPGAVFFRSNHIPYTLINNAHRYVPTNFSISPKVIAWPGRNFTDNFVIYGGCPEMHEFDVIGAAGTSRVEMSYNTASNANGAIVSNTSGSNPNARVVLSGFSFASIRDDETNGISDRALHLQRILTWLGGSEPFPTAVGPGIANHLAQNYPNPFNPSTTIGFSIKDSGHVLLAVYSVSGERIRTLADEAMKAGAYSREWNGRNDRGQAVASGVYFYQITTPSFTSTRKLVLLK